MSRGPAAWISFMTIPKAYGVGRSPVIVRRPSCQKRVPRYLRMFTLGCMNWYVHRSIQDSFKDFPQLTINPQPSPRLPVELISIICEFVSGDRALATLASVNTSCSLFRSISMSILYETVFWDDKTDWISVFPRDHECWKHIKWVISWIDWSCS
jgi:hypothetical protein